MRAMVPWLLVTLFTVSMVSACGAAPREPELRSELLRMLDRDQAFRTMEAPEAQWRRVEEANTLRMKQIVDAYGWPGWSLVGEDGATAAWALVQHSDFDLEFQRKGLALMRKAVGEGDAEPSELAFLEDRVRVAEGRPQVYGTQWEMSPEGEWRPRTPIENEARVDERRAEAGMKPLREYLRELRNVAG
ncbi:DUF6624 domain-containing protein [Nonomuraea sp. NPDC048916]|uniref:DUF6624 domain-containing protein n=1 Tax=Nonomuraea sp. NPDC048916 TaxID=3154232 RepID=UPI00340BB487